MSAEFESLLGEMRTTNRLLALILMKGSTQTQAIADLRRAALQPKDIAELLDTTSNTVRVALSTMKAKRKAKAKR